MKAVKGNLDRVYEITGTATERKWVILHIMCYIISNIVFSCEFQKPHQSDNTWLIKIIFDENYTI